MKSTLAVIFYSFVYVTFTIDYVNADVETFDPESLYQHFKNLQRSAHQMDGKAEELPAGLSYFTPITEQLLNNGTVSRDVILDYYNAITDDQKKKLYNVDSQLRACWREAKDQSQSSKETYQSCYFNSFTGKCKNRYNSVSVAKGETQMKLVSCLGQRVSGVLELLGESFGRSKKSTASNHGLSVEFGFGFSFGLYVSGSTGVAYGLKDSDPTNHLTTATSCCGVKMDLSAGGSVSVSYFFDMDDIPGESVTVEMGADVPLTEVGIDFLLHYNHITRKVIGFGLSFGVGVGLIPIDFASSFCKTQVLAHYRSSVLIAIGPFSGWKCSTYLLGVVSDGRRICCPEDNPDEDCTEFCWFTGTECPHTPKQLAAIKGVTGVEWVMVRAVCPGQTYIPAGQYNEKKCEDLWKSGSQRVLLWRKEPQECWFSDYSIDTCSWAPISTGTTIWISPQVELAEIGINT